MCKVLKDNQGTNFEYLNSKEITYMKWVRIIFEYVKHFYKISMHQTKNIFAVDCYLGYISENIIMISNAK